VGGAVLRESGFQVTVVENANREALETAVQKFLDTFGNGDVALFCYSGHANGAAQRKLPKLQACH
jgi:hypothetical protein